MAARNAESCSSEVGAAASTLASAAVCSWARAAAGSGWSGTTQPYTQAIVRRAVSSVSSIGRLRTATSSTSTGSTAALCSALRMLLQSPARSSGSAMRGSRLSSASMVSLSGMSSAQVSL